MDGDPYQRLAKREIYRNPWLAVEHHDIVHPTGTPGEHVLIVGQRPCGVVVVDGEELVLTLQPRFAARRVMLEICKGGADPGESDLACAQRELAEELGLHAASWQALGSTFELPSLMEIPIALFYATDLTRVEKKLEATEAILEHRMPFAQGLADALSGVIEDAVTALAILRAAHVR